MKTSNNHLPICLIYVISLAIFLTVSFNGQAQNVGINNPAPHSKALLDLTSSDKGLLAPRLSQAQRLAMFPGPDATAAGMLVYQTDLVKGFYYFDGVNWNMVSDEKAGWSLTGNANTDSTVNFIGTTDNQPWIIKTNNIEAARVMTNGNTGIGTASPVQKLHVAGNVNLSNDTNNIRVNNVRAFSVKGSGNLFAGEYAGINNTGDRNTFIGDSSGIANTTGYANTVVGQNAFKSNVNGMWNTAVGVQALEKNTSGFSNSAFGIGALTSNTIGYRNAAFGGGSMNANTTGIQNAACGYYSMHVNTTGNFNSAMGDGALMGNTTGSNNVAVGHTALPTSSSASNNTAIGYNSGFLTTTGEFNFFGGSESGYSNTTGYDNSFVGYRSGKGNSSGYRNSAFGSNALAMNTTGWQNSGFGYNVLNKTTTGSWNTAMGAYTLAENTTGFYNVGVGIAAGAVNTIGSWNTFLGSDAGRLNTEGHANVFVGFEAGFNNTITSDNVFIGTRAGRANTSGFANTFAGHNSGLQNTTGYNNSFFGREAGKDNTTGYENAFFGGYAGWKNTTGINNTFIGRDAGLNNTTGNSNTFIGEVSGWNTVNGEFNTFVGQYSGVQNTSGTGNVFVGQNSGTGNTTGTNNVAIGKDAAVGASLTNANAIGAGASAAVSNSLILGANGTNVGIGTSSPAFPLSFDNNHGDKISLWGGPGNTYGFGIQPNTLQIHSGSVVDDIAFGYGPSGAFVESMRIKGNGNIGMGITNAAYKLHVVDDYIPFAIQSNLATGYSGMHYLNNSGAIVGHMGYGNASNCCFADRMYAGSTTNIPFVLTTNNAERIRIEGNGNIGINNATPAFPLSFNNSLGDKISLWGTSGNHYGFGIQTSQFQIHTANVNDDVVFGYGASASMTETMRIKGNGNVGIGTNNPSSKLHVVTNTASVPVRIQNLNNASFSGMHFHDNAGTLMGHMGYANSGSGALNSTMYIGSVAAVPAVITTGNVERVRIDAAGNVGIGTSTPTTELEVDGFTKLGSDAPAIKVKKITTITPAAGNTGPIAHGLNYAKILSVSVLILNGSGALVPPGSPNSNDYYSYTVNSTNINVVIPSGSTGVAIKNIRLLITYEE